MSVMLPQDLVFVLNLIGFNWPQADEDKLRQSAQHWREYAAELEHVIADTNRILDQVMPDNSGESIDALEQHWRDFGQHLRKAHEAAGVVGEVLDDFAWVVEGLKGAVVAQLLILAGELAATTGAAIFTFGAAEAAAPEEIGITQMIMRGLSREAIQKAERLVVEKVSKAVTEHFLSIKNGLKALKASRTALKDFGKGLLKSGAKDLEHSGAHTPTTALVPWREWPEKDGFLGGYSRTYVLKPTTRIDRFGRPGGRFVSPEGTPFKARGLPSSRQGDPHIVYQVERRLPVRKGVVAPWKDSAGFGVQYHLPAGAQDLVEAGYLKVIEP